MENLLAFLKEEPMEEGYKWYFDGKLVIEMENLKFHFYSEPFRMRVLRFLRNHSIMYRERFDENKESYYEITQIGLNKFLKISK